jgi:apolipoprotein N-acyltransferase
MALSVYRAVELRLDLVRAVNTGVSTFIDSTGRVLQQTKSVDPDETPNKDPEPMTLLGDVAVQQASTLYATLGDWFGGMCLVVLCVLGLRAASAAGRPVRWKLVASGAGLLAAVITLGTAIGAGPSQIGLAWLLLTHQKIPEGVIDAAFSTGVRLIPILAIGSFAVGLLVERLGQRDASHRRASFEAAAAILSVLVVPAVAVGTLEGEQAGLVIAALIAIGLSALGGRVAQRKSTA